MGHEIVTWPVSLCNRRSEEKNVIFSQCLKRQRSQVTQTQRIRLARRVRCNTRMRKMSTGCLVVVKTVVWT